MIRILEDKNKAKSLQNETKINNKFLLTFGCQIFNSCSTNIKAIYDHHVFFLLENFR